MMGSSLRRLRIYYLNNFRYSRLLILCALVVFAYFLFGPTWNKESQKYHGIVRYKAESNTHRMTDEEIKSTLDSLEDSRPVKCRDQAYDFTRLDVEESISILTEFSGETFYDLKLTLNSIVEHTPFDLYEEIVVLDDGSENLELRRHVATYLRNPKFAKVKVYRSDRTEGEAASRFKATLLAKGTILVFVGSDTVVNHGWIQPLVAKVSANERLVAVPHADNLLSDNRFYRTEDHLVNVFTWKLSTVYAESPIRDSEMLATGVMRGDAFAVKKSFLTSVGNFDEHMMPDGGGHHVELSFRTWMCGGTIEVATCSHVAVKSSLRPQHTTSPINYRRIVELWMGEFKDLVYRQGGVSPVLTADESQSIAMRRNYLDKQTLGCRTFAWYLQNVAPDVVTPSDDAKKYGKLKAKTNFCLRQVSAAGPDVEMTLCSQHMYERAMMFEWNSQGWIFRGDQCLEASDADGRAELQACNDAAQKQVWRLEGAQLTPMTSSHHCLTQVSERDSDTLDLVHFAQLKPCGEDEERKQKWNFINY